MVFALPSRFSLSSQGSYCSIRPHWGSSLKIGCACITNIICTYGMFNISLKSVVHRFIVDKLWMTFIEPLCTLVIFCSSTLIKWNLPLQDHAMGMHFHNCIWTNYHCYLQGLCKWHFQFFCFEWYKFVLTLWLLSETKQVF